MYAALRALPVPDEVVARLFHAASLLREHRGDGHIAALMVEGVGGLEAHVLLALDMDMPAEKFGRIHHLPAAQLAAVIDGMRDRGLIGDDGWLSEQGRAVKQRVEALTDDLAAKPYEVLEPDELDELDGRPRAARRAAPRRPGVVAARQDRQAEPKSGGARGGRCRSGRRGHPDPGGRGAPTHRRAVHAAVGIAVAVEQGSRHRAITAPSRAGRPGPGRRPGSPAPPRGPGRGARRGTRRWRRSAP